MERGEKQPDRCLGSVQTGMCLRPCRPFNPASANGAVERWLIECEAAMRDTVKATIKQSFNAYSNTPRDMWMGSWPGQVVLAVDCMYWTANTASAIVKGTLGKYANHLTQQLMQVGLAEHATGTIIIQYCHGCQSTCLSLQIACTIT